MIHAIAQAKLPPYPETKCVWFLGHGKNCGAKTKYKMVPDKGRFGAPLVKKYNRFCDKHLIALASVKEELPMMKRRGRPRKDSVIREKKELKETA